MRPSSPRKGCGQVTPASMVYSVTGWRVEASRTWNAMAASGW